MADARTDRAKGRLKEAAGALTGDAALKRSGRLDQAAADVKESVEKAVDKTRELLGGRKPKRTRRRSEPQ